MDIGQQNEIKILFFEFFSFKVRNLMDYVKIDKKIFKNLNFL